MRSVVCLVRVVVFEAAKLAQSPYLTALQRHSFTRTEKLLRLPKYILAAGDVVANALTLGAFDRCMDTSTATNDC